MSIFATAEIVSGGRITLPKHIREALNLKVGARVMMVVQDDKRTIVLGNEKHFKVVV